MKYLAFIIVFSLFISYKMKAQESIILDLKKEIIDEVILPIKIGKVTSSVPNSEIGTARIPELNKDFNITFKENMANAVSDYIGYLQAGEKYNDTIHLHISKFRISEKINEFGDEVGTLEVEFRFSKTINFEEGKTYVFKDKIEISDPNVTIFHEYNVRKGIIKSMNWLAIQPTIKSNFKIIPQPKTQKKILISADSALQTFRAGDLITRDFAKIEEIMLQSKDKKIENRIAGRSFVNTVAGGVGIIGMISTTIGVVKYSNASEEDVDPGNAGEFLLGGLGCILTAVIIDNIGKKKYRENIIKRYNEHQMKQSNISAPYNPIKLGFAVPIK